MALNPAELVTDLGQEDSAKVGEYEVASWEWDSPCCWQC